MSTHKRIDLICVIITILALVVTVLFMNGEKLGLIAIVDEDAESYTGDINFTANDLDGSWSTEEATVITMNGDTSSISGSGAFLYEGSIYISNGGTYVLSGELTDGSIIVDAYQSSKVFLMLDNVTIHREDDAAIRVEQADKVFLTLKEGTENTLSSGSEYSDTALADNTGGVIFTHDDLTINGSGSLIINGEYKHGIDANDDLVITGGSISITCPGDAVHVNDAFKLREASLSINSEDDGIHAGTILIDSGTVEILGCYEGLEALTIEMNGGSVSIHCSDDGFNANGGSSGFGMGPGQTQEAEESGTDTEESWIHINGGTIEIINTTGRDADGLDSNGDILITGGDIRISLSGDGSNCAIDYASESGGVCEISGGVVVACGGSSMVEGFSSTSTQYSILYNLSSVEEAGTEISLKDSDGNVLLSYEPEASFSSVHLSSPELVPEGTYTLLIGNTEEEITLSEVAGSYGEASGGMGGGFPSDSEGESGMMHGGHRGSGFHMDDSENSQNMTPPEHGSEFNGGMHPGAEVEEETAQSTFTSIADLDPSVLLLLLACGIGIVLALIFAILFRRRR